MAKRRYAIGSKKRFCTQWTTWLKKFVKEDAAYFKKFGHHLSYTSDVYEKRRKKIWTWYYIQPGGFNKLTKKEKGCLQQAITVQMAKLRGKKKPLGGSVAAKSALKRGDTFQGAANGKTSTLSRELQQSKKILKKQLLKQKKKRKRNNKNK